MDTSEQKKTIETFFSPDPQKGVVVFGATEQRDPYGNVKLGQRIAENILLSYKGKVSLVNPSRATVLDQHCYHNLSEIPTRPDLAIIVTPAKAVPKIMEECVAAGVPATVVLSAGFEEFGEEGKKLAEEVKRIAAGKTRVAGPNCFGVVGPGMNCTFSRVNPAPGNIGVISQSGGLLSWLLDTDASTHLGISRAASTGSMLDVTWAEWLQSFGDDPNTKAIVIYMEQLGRDAAGFMKVATEVAKKKLIIALKSGKTEEAGKAAASHTGALVGNDEIYDAVFKKCGILRADTSEQLFRILKLAQGPLPKGNRLAIITNGGGSAVIAADALVLAGGKLAELAPETIEKLNKVLTEVWSHRNPIDVIGDATPERYRAAIEAALQDGGNDGVSVTYVPVAMTDPADIAKIIIELRSKYPDKPLFASFMGTKSVEEAKKMLVSAEVPVFSTTESAAQTFAKLSFRAEWIKENEEEEVELAHVSERTKEMDAADEMMKKIVAEKRTILTEHEAKQIFRAYGIPANETMLAEDEENAVLAAEKIGYPAVLKLHSFSLTHKTEVKGVELNLENADAVRAAFKNIKSKIEPKDFHGVCVQAMEKVSGEEILLGAKTDPSFGHAIVFGQGGTRAEYYKDTVVTLPPIGPHAGRHFIEGAKIGKILEEGWRGSRPANVNELGKIIAGFSRFLDAHPEVSEVDINPLMVSAEKIVALDARIILHE